MVKREQDIEKKIIRRKKKKKGRNEWFVCVYKTYMAPTERQGKKKYEVKILR